MHLQQRTCDLGRFASVDFDNPPAERAVLFSTPGGLMRTAVRERRALRKRWRKIEGSHVIYKYLDELPGVIAVAKVAFVGRLPQLRIGLQRRHGHDSPALRTG